MKRTLFIIVLLSLFISTVFAGRYYDPEIGRFTQIDPKWEKYPSTSPYAYCLNNPLKYIDPDGQKVMSVNQVNTFETVLISSSAIWRAEMNNMNSTIKNNGLGFGMIPQLSYKMNPGIKMAGFPSLDGSIGLGLFENNPLCGIKI